MHRRPLFPLLPQGGSSDSTAAQGRRRVRRATQMVRFAVLKLRAARTFHDYRKKKHLQNTFRCVFANVPVEQDNCEKQKLKNTVFVFRNYSPPKAQTFLMCPRAFM